MRICDNHDSGFGGRCGRVVAIGTIGTFIGISERILRGSSEEIEEMKKVLGEKYNFQDIEQWTYVNRESDSPSAFVIFFNHEGYVASLYAL